MKIKSMKRFLIIGCVFLLSASFTGRKQDLYGRWKMVSGQINGQESSQIQNLRYWEFNKDNSFEGEIIIQDVARPYNQGIFMLPDDTTMVTIHADRNGHQYPVAYKYNYRIQNDTLHLYGFYMNPIPDNPQLLQAIHIDEWWVKVE